MVTNGLTSLCEERYCSYEVARLLKEKGFDEECDFYYEHSTDEPHEITRDEIVESCNLCIKAPTHQMACDWLREVHKIFIEISVSIDLNGDYHYRYSILNRKCEYLRKGYTSFDWTYKDTVEEAIKYSLENLV